MSQSVPSSNHLNALAIAMIQYGIINLDEAWMIHRMMISQSRAYVATFYEGRSDWIMPQSLNDSDFPFDPDMYISPVIDRLPGMIGYYLDNSCPNDRINPKLDLLTKALLHDNPDLVAPDKADRFGMPNGYLTQSPAPH